MDIEGRDWGTLEEAWKGVRTSIPYLVMKAQMKNDLGDRTYEECISKRLSEQTDFHLFSLLAQGTSTIVMLAQSDDDLTVLRFSSHPDTPNGRIMKDDCNRCEFPGLLQPVRDNVIIGSDIMQVEVLPLVQLHKLSNDDYSTYNQYTSMLLEDTVYKNNVHETAILPDSTLISFDPGEVPYTDEYWELDDEQKVAAEERSKDLILMRLESWNIPENLKPVNNLDGLKQDTALGRSYMNNINPNDLDSSVRPEI